MRFLSRVWRAASAAVLAGAVIAHPAAGQQAPSVTEKLIELLVKNGVLSKDQAGALLKEAQDEARAGAHPAPRSKTAEKAPAKTGAAPPQKAESGQEAVPPGTVRVTYVPKIVRDQIAEQVRQEVMQQAQADGWAAPNQLPDWVHRITVFGDMRIRDENVDFPHGNAPFVNFPAINQGSPYDITGSQGGPPLLDTTENRNFVNLRARFGVRAQIDDWISSEVRIATGNDASPVSTNQTLGQNGEFAKYAIWLDRAFVTMTPAAPVTLFAGRMPNPFWTTNLLYYDELSFDGFAVSSTYPVYDGVAVFGVAGAFPTFNTAFNFGTTTTYPSRNSWLFAIQGGAEWRINRDYSAKLGIGYFKYSNIQGKLSSPCLIQYTSDTCSTDNTRSLWGIGNTVFPIRNLVTNPNNPNGPQPQYFGLASNFDVLDVHLRLGLDNFRPVGIALEGDYAKNLAFNRDQAGANAVNNIGNNNYYVGGDTAWMVRLTVGTPEVLKRWDWNAFVGYKYLASDAILAALTDPDFHLGGTNAKGVVAGGALGVAHNTWVDFRFFGANQVSGPTYAVDVFQSDLNVRF